jgi:hypothetical protein
MYLSHVHHPRDSIVDVSWAFLMRGDEVRLLTCVFGPLQGQIH